MSEPTAAESEDGQKRRHGNRRRTAFFLGVGAGGMIAGLAVCAALAHPAGAAPLPVSSVPVTSAPVSALVAAAVVPVTDQAASSLPAVPRVSNSVATLPLSAVKEIGALPIPIQVGVVGVNVPTALPVTVIDPVIGSGTTTDPIGTGPLAAAAVPPRTSGRSISPSHLRSSSVLLPQPQPKVPVGPSPAPIAPILPPGSLLSAEIVSSTTSSGQGGGPFGALPPSSLILPALVMGGVVLALRTRPQLLLDARSSPPG